MFPSQGTEASQVTWALKQKIPDIIANNPLELVQTFARISQFVFSPIRYILRLIEYCQSEKYQTVAFHIIFFLPLKDLQKS